MERFSFLAALVILVACGAGPRSSGNGNAPSSPAPAFSSEDKRAVEALIRDWLTAFAERDTETRLELSTGELRTSLEVGQAAGLTGGAPATLTFEGFQVQQADATEATVLIDAAALFPNDPTPVGFSGPATAVKTSEGWRLQDLTRNGRSLTEAFFSRVSGSGSASQVDVEAIAAWIEPNFLDIYIDISNDGSVSVELFEAPILIDESGRQISGGTIGTAGSVTIAPDATLTTVLSWETAMPAEPMTLRLSLTLHDAETFDEIPLQLRIQLRE